MIVTVAAGSEASPDIRRRVVAANGWAALDQVAFALAEATNTHRPAYREIIETLRWEELL